LIPRWRTRSGVTQSGVTTARSSAVTGDRVRQAVPLAVFLSFRELIQGGVRPNRRGSWMRLSGWPTAGSSDGRSRSGAALGTTPDGWTSWRGPRPSSGHSQRTMSACGWRRRSGVIGGGRPEQGSPAHAPAAVTSTTTWWLNVPDRQFGGRRIVEHCRAEPGPSADGPRDWTVLRASVPSPL
jgi:hypothetical protein